METEYIFILLLLLVLVYFIKIMPRKDPTTLFEETISPFHDK
tara:strand:+ start:2389 stop:2514 length:126 start_codon:yes stop_codon:yes gene_type:complete